MPLLQGPLVSGELTALFSLLLRSPDEHSLRGAWEGPWLPGESAPGPRSSCHRRPVLGHRPTLRFPAAHHGRPATWAFCAEPVRLHKESCRGHSGAAPVSLGAWPRPPSPARPWLHPLKRRTRTRRRRRPEGPQPSQPGDGPRRQGQGCGPSSCPDCPNHFYFLILSVYSIDQRANLF